jgi:tyrosine-protein kinase Fer
MFEDGNQAHEVAIKSLGAAGKKLIHEEINSIASASSPFIVKLFGFCEVGQDYQLVMELMTKGSLYDLLHISKTHLAFEVRTKLMQDIIQGLDYLHKINLVHANMKSTNVLLHEHQGQLSAKLSNYGLPHQNDAVIATKKLNASMLALWTAPEFLESSTCFTQAGDIYSFAIIMWELAAEEIPHKEFGAIGLKYEVLNGGRDTMPLDCPNNIASLINKCWEQRAQDRPTAEWVKDKLMAVKSNVAEVALLSI